MRNSKAVTSSKIAGRGKQEVEEALALSDLLQDRVASEE